MNWYDFYEIIRNEILNIYVFKFSKNLSNKYFINDNRIKLIYVKFFFSRINVCFAIANDISKRKY